MYDCQSDRYTDFSAPTPASANLALTGSLTARAAGRDAHDALAALAAHAERLGHAVERAADAVRVDGLGLADALALNAAHGATLLIDCDLRARRAVRQTHID
ncbi:hypothetical protein EV683_10443 [Crenobacter luteus]|uniref:Uncharacterized protein n=1 Tax=Crenobacter luteus TaxID=1452487 RepID=A0A165EME8_9NEIS|nr:hypothetical protein [Crenobacter luteus]KZE25944.1 hypothetical protein AVW16_02660 [Crenobacter luteus]TCP14495.1 hypothetical protein EV683_10443 [Crenobacter luteus]